MPIRVLVYFGVPIVLIVFQFIPLGASIIPGLPPQEPIGGAGPFRVIEMIQTIVLTTPGGKVWLYCIWIYFGFVAYTLRYNLRLIYGFAEMIAAVLLSYNAIATLIVPHRPSNIELLSLLSGIYVAVRAFDNIDNGLSQDYQIRWRRLISW
jgi:hypothetical protein